MGDPYGREPVEEDGGTEAGTEAVEEDEDGEGSRTIGRSLVILCCFSAMEWAETEPERFIQVIVG